MQYTLKSFQISGNVSSLLVCNKYSMFLYKDLGEYFLPSCIQLLKYILNAKYNCLNVESNQFNLIAMKTQLLFSLCKYVIYLPD